MYFEELNSGESSVPLWSTGPTWDFGTKAYAFSTVFVTTGSRVFDVSPTRPAFPKAVSIASSRRWSGGEAIRNPGYGKRRKAAVG
jgi:hypothetical protein